MLYYKTINGRKLYCNLEMMEAVYRAHLELVREKVTVWVGYKKYSGLVLGGVDTSSYRTRNKQRDLYYSGKSGTLNSNHMRGTAIDVYPKLNYVKKIERIMAKYKLVNDLSFIGDYVHFNLISNDEARKRPVINLIDYYNAKEYMNVDQKLMDRFEGGYIQRVEKHGEVYKVSNGTIKYLKNHKDSPLFTDWSRFLHKHGYLTGINEIVWDKIKEAKI